MDKKQKDGDENFLGTSARRDPRLPLCLRPGPEWSLSGNVGFRSPLSHGKISLEPGALPAPDRESSQPVPGLPPRTGIAFRCKLSACSFVLLKHVCRPQGRVCPLQREDSPPATGRGECTRAGGPGDQRPLRKLVFLCPFPAYRKLVRSSALLCCFP